MNTHSHWASIAIVTFATIPAVIFPLLFFFRSRWRKNYVGIGLMYQALSIMIIMLYTLFVNIWPTFPFRDYLRIPIFFLIGTMQWVLVIVLRRAQKESPIQKAPHRRATDVEWKEHHGRRS